MVVVLKPENTAKNQKVIACVQIFHRTDIDTLFLLFVVVNHGLNYSMVTKLRKLRRGKMLDVQSDMINSLNKIA